MSILITILQVAYDSNMVEGATDQRAIQILCLFTLSNYHPDHQFECQNARLNMERLKNHQEKSVYTQPSHYCFMYMKNDTRILVDTLLPIVLVSIDRNITCLQNGGVYDDNLKRLTIFAYWQSSQIFKTMVGSKMAVDYVAVLRDSKTHHHHHNEHDKLCTSDIMTTSCASSSKSTQMIASRFLTWMSTMTSIRRDNITFIFYTGESEMVAKFRITSGIGRSWKETFFEVKYAYNMLIFSFICIASLVLGIHFSDFFANEWVWYQL